ncbi:MAG: hypothetical protein JWO38_8069 [Gemmataceae bacterium]|nr:hypothetical protein [Gemmataceae bacterium]
MTAAALVRSVVHPWSAGRTSARRAPAATGRRRARAAVLTAVVAVGIAHVWLAVVVETSRPEWRDPEYFHRQKRLTAVARWRDMNAPTRPLIAIIGGSRPQMGLSPEGLELGTGPTDPFPFDCVQSGAIPVGERLNLARLLASGVAPEYVLIEVLPPVLADPGPMEYRIPAPRLGYADLARLRPYHSDPGKIPREWARARVKSWYTLRVPLLANWGCADLFPPGPNRSDALWADMRLFGWSPFYPADWPAARRAVALDVARKTYSWLLADFRVTPVNDRAYRDMLGECRARGARAALFLMPESPTFRGWYPPAVRGQITAYLAGLSREFGVPVFDASGWVDDEAAFMDGHHLLGPGAEAFSKRFGRECVGPWVKSVKNEK